MKHSCLLFYGVLICFLSSVWGSYDQGYGVAADNTYEASYAAPPVAHGQGHGHSAGSYYHYHVPLVGQQQQHHQPYYHHPPQQHDHLHYLIPLLLLLAALPLLFLPLLPLLLIPLGLSLLALLMPGGMMMMMMMMMMMPMMGPPGVRDTISGRAAEMRSIGELVMNDMTSLASKYARSLDLDKCPERIACELGVVLFPSNSSQASTAKSFMNYIVEQAIPKGKTRKIFRSCRDAFWSGSSTSNCSSFHCQPTIRMFTEKENAKYFHQSQPYYVNPIYTENVNANNTAQILSENLVSSGYTNSEYGDYYTKYQHQLGNTNYTFTKADEKIAKAYYDYYTYPAEVTTSASPMKEVKPNKGKAKIKVNKYYSTFGTPTVMA